MRDASLGQVALIVMLGVVLVAGWAGAAKLRGADLANPPRWATVGTAISIAVMVVLVLQVPKRF